MNEAQGHTVHVFACDCDEKDGLQIQRVGACLQAQTIQKGGRYGPPVNLNAAAVERLARVCRDHLSAVRPEVPA